MSKKKILSTCKALVKKAKTPLNVERIKACSGFKNITDREAKELIQTLETMAEIAIRQINRLKPKGFDFMF